MDTETQSVFRKEQLDTASRIFRNPIENLDCSAYSNQSTNERYDFLFPYIIRPENWGHAVCGDFEDGKDEYLVVMGPNWIPITGIMSYEEALETAVSKELRRLKSNWVADDCWDLEDTPTFQGFRDELKKYADEKRAEWAAQREQKLLAKAEDLGVPGNKKLAKYIMNLESRIDRLNEAAENMYFKLGYPNQTRS